MRVVAEMVASLR